MAGEHIDLSLAVNYLPAVECSLKGIFLCFVLVFISPGDHLGVYTIMSLLLNIDRVISRTRIFDGNALLCTVLASHVINFLRAGVAPVPFLIGPFVTLIWLACSVVLITEPEVVRGYLADKARLRRILPALVTGFGIGSLAFTPMPAESMGLKFVRSLGFLMLCVIWVYVIGVWRRNSMNESFNQNLIAKFCPFLFVQLGYMLFFLLICFCLLAFHVSRDSHVSPSVSSPAPPPTPGPHVAVSVSRQSMSVPVPASGAMHTIQEEGPGGEDKEDLETFFKMACQARGTQVGAQYGEVSGRIGSKIDV